MSAEDQTQAFATKPGESGVGVGNIGSQQEWVVRPLLKTNPDFVLAERDLQSARSRRLGPLYTPRHWRKEHPLIGILSEEGEDC